MRAKYIGENPNLGFVKGNEYEIVIQKRKFGFIVLANYDYTLNEKTDKCCSYQDNIRVKNNWYEIKDENNVNNADNAESRIK